MKRKFKIIAGIIFILLIGMLLISIVNARDRIENYNYDGYDRRYKINYTLFDAENFTGTRIDLSGNATADNFIGTHVGNSSIWSRAGTDTFLTNSGDNVGIGTNNPQSILHINGTPGVEALDQGIMFGDGDTGFYEQADDLLRVAIAGTSRYVFGNNFMGTTVGSGGAFPRDGGSLTIPSIYVYRSDTNTGFGGDGSDKISFITGGSGRMLIDSDGNVGVGTDSPEELLDVFSDTAADATLQFRSAISNARIKLKSDTNSKTSVIGFYDGIDSNTLIGGLLLNRRVTTVTGAVRNDVILFTQSGSEQKLHLATEQISALTIDKEQNVGIGTASPSSPLYVYNDDIVGAKSGIVVENPNSNSNTYASVDYINDQGGTGFQTGLYSSNGAGGRDNDAFFFNGVTGGGIGFWTSGADNRLQIQSDGNVGIGTTSPDAKLNVVGNTGESGVLRIENEGSQTHTILDFYNANSAPSSYRNIFQARQSRGTLASPTALAEDDVIFTIGANGHDGTNYQTKFSQDIIVDGTVSTGVVPMAMVWKTGDTAATRTEKMRLSSNGNFGIGTTNPGAKLDVNGSISIGDNDKVLIGDAHDFSIGTDGNSLNITTEVGNGNFIFDANTGNYIFLNGNVGIGTTSPQNKLNVVGDGNFTTDLYVGGKVEIADRLFVGTTAAETTGVINPGDVGIAGALLVNNTIRVTTRKYGSGFSVDIPGAAASSANRTFFFTSAKLNTSTGLFCDFANNPIRDADEGEFLGIIVSDVFGFTPIPFEILDPINSSCATVSLSIFGGDVISDPVTAIIYLITPAPILLIQSDGSSIFSVGSNPDSKFKVNILNGTGDDNALINYRAGVSGSHGLDVDSDLLNFSGGGALHLNLFSSGSILNGLSHNLLLTSDLLGFSDGVFNGIEFILPNKGTNMEATMIKVEGEWTNLIKKGTPEELNKSWYDSTIALTDITDEINNVSVSTNVYELDDSITYYGNEINFTSISFSLDVLSLPLGITPIFWYCDGDNNWNILPSVSDGTNGFAASGEISFTNPIDRGACNTQINGTAFSDATDYTYIAIQRTRNIMTTTPSINLVSISSEEPQFLLREDLIKLSPVISPPLTCEANLEGAQYNDDDLGLPCWCNGVNWVQMNDFSTVCT